MKFKNINIFVAFLISAVLHFLFFFVFYTYVNGLTFKPPKENVIEIDLRGGDWKIADIEPPEVPMRPDKAKHLGTYDSKVEEETVAAETGRAPGRPASRGGEGIGKLKDEAKKFAAKGDMPWVKEEAYVPSGGASRIPEDFYPDYKKGGHTYINVLKHPDVGYFVMLKRIFKLAWDPTGVLMGHRMNGEISRGSIKVVLGLAIDASGEINELFVINSSGLDDYDEEALRAIRASAPFSSPPGKLLAADKILRVSWTFVVYM